MRADANSREPYAIGCNPRQSPSISAPDAGLPVARRASIRYHLR